VGRFLRDGRDSGKQSVIHPKFNTVTDTQCDTFIHGIVNTQFDAKPQCDCKRNTECNSVPVRYAFINHKCNSFG
jgi:hypothetical protein